MCKFLWHLLGGPGVDPLARARGLSSEGEKRATKERFLARPGCHEDISGSYFPFNLIFGCITLGVPEEFSDITEDERRAFVSRPFQNPLLRELQRRRRACEKLEKWTRSRKTWEKRTGRALWIKVDVPKSSPTKGVWALKRRRAEEGERGTGKPFFLGF